MSTILLSTNDYHTESAYAIELRVRAREEALYMQLQMSEADSTQIKATVNKPARNPIASYIATLKSAHRILATVAHK